MLTVQLKNEAMLSSVSYSVLGVLVTPNEKLLGTLRTKGYLVK